jgi:hypothetical protein
MKKNFVNNSGYGLFGTFMATLHYLNNMQEISMVTVKGYKSTATVIVSPLSQSLAQHRKKEGLLLGERAAPWRKRVAVFWKKAAPQEKKSALFAPTGRPRMWQTRPNVKSTEFVLSSC